MSTSTRVAVVATTLLIAAASAAAAFAATRASGAPTTTPPWLTVKVVCSGTTPTICVTVSCPTNPRMGIPCRALPTTSAPAPTATQLVLRLPRALAQVALLCRTAGAPSQLGCRVTSSKVTKATGLRTATVLLPLHFTTTHILCRTQPTGRFACRAHGTT